MKTGDALSAVAIKLCGLRTVEDARAAVLAGADLIGLVFVPGARRYVSPSIAAEMVSAVRQVAGEVERNAPEIVGVIGPMQTFDAVTLACTIGVGALQLAGDDDECSRLADAIREAVGESFPLIRAIGVPDDSDVEIARVAALARTWESRGARVTFDAQVDGQLGGTGKRLSTKAIRPLLAEGRRGLAGGLTPENVADVIREFRPAMVDVSSGIESSPGRKDPERMRAFVVAARDASSHLLTHSQRGAR